MAALPDMRFEQYLTSSASGSWVNRCRLLRDVAVGLYQKQALGAQGISFSLQHLYLDRHGRAQITPILSEEVVTETDEVFALGQLIWHTVSRSTALAKDWQKGAELPRTCPPALIALLQACTNPIVSERPS